LWCDGQGRELPRNNPYDYRIHVERRGVHGLAKHDGK
jgi:hypothetical protein